MPVVGLFLDPTSGDGSLKELQGIAKTWHMKYSAVQRANVPFPAFCSYQHYFHTIRHVYRSMWPAREAKPRFGAVLVHSVHDCETHLLHSKNLHLLHSVNITVVMWCELVQCKLVHALKNCCCCFLQRCMLLTPLNFLEWGNPNLFGSLSQGPPGARGSQGYPGLPGVKVI